jgi:hypothetical protein
MISLPLCVGDLYRLTREPFTTLCPPHATTRLIIMLLYEKVIHVNGKAPKRERNAKKINLDAEWKRKVILFLWKFYLISWRWQFPYFPSHFPSPEYVSCILMCLKQFDEYVISSHETSPCRRRLVTQKGGNPAYATDTSADPDRGWRWKFIEVHLVSFLLLLHLLVFPTSSAMCVHVNRPEIIITYLRDLQIGSEDVKSCAHAIPASRSTKSSPPAHT